MADRDGEQCNPSERNSALVDAPSILEVAKPDTGPSLLPIVAKRESSRSFIANFLLTILLIEVLFAITATWLPGAFGLKDITMPDLKDIMMIVFSPTAALVGSAAGYYFGKEAEQAGNS